MRDGDTVEGKQMIGFDDRGWHCSKGDHLYCGDQNCRCPCHKQNTRTKDEHVVIGREFYCEREGYVWAQSEQKFCQVCGAALTRRAA